MMKTSMRMRMRMRTSIRIQNGINHVPSGALIMISAPVNSAPQRYGPPSGDVASWDSRKSNWVRRFWRMNFDSTALAMRMAKGRRKKGVFVLIAEEEKKKGVRC